MDQGRENPDISGSTNAETTPSHLKVRPPLSSAPSIADTSETREFRSTWTLRSVLNGVDTNVKVSSTLDKASNKANLLDGSDETCWSSKEMIPATHIALTFQGGFVGTTCAIYLATTRPGAEAMQVNLGLVYAGTIYPKDGNKRQVFEIPLPEAVLNLIPASVEQERLDQVTGTIANRTHRDWVKELKLVFEKSSDPFGRITVYNVELLEAQE